MPNIFRFFFSPLIHPCWGCSLVESLLSGISSYWGRDSSILSTSIREIPTKRAPAQTKGASFVDHPKICGPTIPPTFPKATINAVPTARDVEPFKLSVIHAKVGATMAQTDPAAMTMTKTWNICELSMREEKPSTIKLKTANKPGNMMWKGRSLEWSLWRAFVTTVRKQKK